MAGRCVNDTMLSEFGNPSIKLVAIFLAWKADKRKHLAWPSIATIAVATTLKRRQVQNIMRTLENMRFIERVSQAHRYTTPRYRILCRGATDYTSVGRGAVDCIPGVQPIAPKPSVVTNGLSSSLSSENPSGLKTESPFPVVPSPKYRGGYVQRRLP